MRRAAIIGVVLVVLVLLLVILLCRREPAPVSGGFAAVLGGLVRKRPASPHVVVDTLNLTHWRSAGNDQTMTREKIVAAIDETAAALKAKWPGRVMYVVKDRESRFNDDVSRAAYKAAADRNGVYLYLVEQYEDPPPGPEKNTHSSLGRDDFYTALLAHRWRCPVLTEDKLRDFDAFRGTVPPFHVYEYAFWRELPTREYVKPSAAAHRAIRRPLRFGFATVLEHPTMPAPSPVSKN